MPRILPLLALLACNADEKPATTCTITPPDPGRLRAEGVTLRDATDRVVLLRGVNAGGRSKFPPYAPFDYDPSGDGFATALDAYLDEAANWGIDVLRVPFTWAALEPTRGTWDEAWLARYEALLDGAAARGLWTIVDAHQDIYGEFYCGDGFPAWTVEDPPEAHHDCPDWFTGYLGDPLVSDAFDALWTDRVGTRSAYTAMWAALAAREADRPGVIGFEFLNEPFRGTADSATWAQETLPGFYTEVGDAVRAVAPDHLLFFDATGTDAVAAFTSIVPPEGDNWVFAPHWYDAAVLAGGSTTSADPDLGLGAWRAQGDAWDLPVMIGEMGVDPGLSVAEDFAEAQWAALDRHGLAATWWEYSAAAERWNDEALSLVDADGTPFEAVVDPLARPYPRAVAGEDATWSLVDGTFTLDFTSTPGGITEIALPTRDPAWAAAAVTVSGGCADPRADRVLFQADGGGAARIVLRR